jgi:hypothetical protein
MSEQATTEVVQDTQTGQEPSAQLQLSDLILCAQAIQLAAQRGAFKPEEFTQVGGAFDRVTAFLRDSGAIKSTEPAGETADQSSAE